MLKNYDEALEELLQRTSIKQPIEDYPLLKANHLVLAENIYVQYDTPFFSNSAMDGYALGGDPCQCSEWQITNRIAAGDPLSNATLQTGEAARIFTGAPIPPGTSAVIQQENTKIENNTLTFTSQIKKGQNIRYQGEELKKGDILLTQGHRLTPASVALLASQGYQNVKIYKPLTIWVYSTGNELINPGQPLSSGKIFDANRYLLITWLQKTRHHVIDAGILPDNRDKTEIALKKAGKEADIIISSGGVSVGEEDHVHAALQQLGQLIFWKLAIKPGKPFAWGQINSKIFFMLPGNPVSTLVTFQQLVIPALRHLAGETLQNCLPKTILAQAQFEKRKTQARREFLRVRVDYSQSPAHVSLLNNQGSAMLATFSQANGLAEIPENTPVHKGDFIKIYPLDYSL